MSLVVTNEKVLNDLTVGGTITAPNVKFSTPQGWEDLRGPLASGKTTFANDPNWITFRDGIKLHNFSANQTNEIWIVYHIPHSYAIGTAIYPHIHWATSGTNTGIVRWGIEWTYARTYSQQAFGASAIIYIETAANSTPYMNQISEVSDAQAIPGTNVEPDGHFLIRLFRDGTHANDTCTDGAFGFECDLHFQIGQNHTPNRNYPFGL